MNKYILGGLISLLLLVVSIGAAPADAVVVRLNTNCPSTVQANVPFECTLSLAAAPARGGVKGLSFNFSNQEKVQSVSFGSFVDVSVAPLYGFFTLTPLTEAGQEIATITLQTDSSYTLDINGMVASFADDSSFENYGIVPAEITVAVTPGACSATNLCPVGEDCVSGQCIVPPEPACTTDDACALNEICSDGECTLPDESYECIVSANCTQASNAVSVCEHGSCEESCVEGAVKEGQECKLSCDFGHPCPQGQLCMGKYCEEIDPCLNVQCAENEQCALGTCECSEGYVTYESNCVLPEFRLNNLQLKLVAILDDNVCYNVDQLCVVENKLVAIANVLKEYFG